MKKMTRNVLITVAAINIFLEIMLKPTTVSAWGDSYVDPETGVKGRPSYTIEEINNGAIGATPKSDGADYKNSPNYPGKIVFNSISNSDPIKDDEKNFVGARVLRDDKRREGNNRTNTWKPNEITVEDGKTYIIRLYVHNNNPNGMDAVAENTHVSFSIPSISAKKVQVNGFIDSSNATPDGYWDNVNFNAEVPFHLEYVYGSALLENNSIGLGGLTLSDDIVKAKSGGTMIGYDALDGKIPGGYQYSSFVTIKVKVVYDYEFNVQTKVRIAGSADRKWRESVDAKVGDKVEFRIEYKNTSDKTQNRVGIRDVLPSNLRYVNAPTILKNDLHREGVTIDQDSIVSGGVLIGNYGEDANAYVYFTAEVIDNNLDQGSNTLVNWGQVGVGERTIQDSATVNVQNDIEYHRILALYIIIIIGCSVVIVALFRKIIKRN